MTDQPATWRPGGLAEPDEPWDTVRRFREIRERLVSRYVGRDRLVDLLQLAVICREHVLLLGPPGTAKTDIAVTFAREAGVAPLFRGLLTKFTEPTEVFGPLDAARFRDGEYHVRTEGMLPEARLAVLDEVFQGSSAILNALLSVIGDRTFHNGRETVPVPLLSLIGTSNSLPADPALAAFTDRFLLRVRVAPVAADRFDELIRLGSEIEAERLAEAISGKIREAGPAHSAFSVDDIDRISRVLDEVNTEDVRPPYGSLVRGLLTEQAELSDRRIVLGLKLVRGAALLRGAMTARPSDLWPIEYIWSDIADEDRLRELVRQIVQDDGGDPLGRSISPEQIARQAEAVADRFENSGDYSFGAIEAALIEINRLRGQLTGLHPRAGAQRHRIDEAAKRVQAYYGRT
jgi:MoxR-like ATPase